MGLSSPLPGECCLGPSLGQGHSSVHIALCVYGGLVSACKGCMGTWVVALQRRVSVGAEGVCCSCGDL